MNEQTRICLENADLALRPPELITPVPREYYPEIDDYTMSSGIARTPGGRFYLSWFGRDDGPDTVMLLARSDDEGKSWSEPEYLIDPGFTPATIFPPSSVPSGAIRPAVSGGSFR